MLTHIREETPVDLSRGVNVLEVILNISVTLGPG